MNLKKTLLFPLFLAAAPQVVEAQPIITTICSLPGISIGCTVIDVIASAVRGAFNAVFGPIAEGAIDAFIGALGVDPCGAFEDLLLGTAPGVICSCSSEATDTTVIPVGTNYVVEIDCADQDLTLPAEGGGSYEFTDFTVDIDANAEIVLEGLPGLEDIRSAGATVVGSGTLASTPDPTFTPRTATVNINANGMVEPAMVTINSCTVTLSGASCICGNTGCTDPDEFTLQCTDTTTSLVVVDVPCTKLEDFFEE